MPGAEITTMSSPYLQRPAGSQVSYDRFIEAAADDPDQAEWVTRAKDYIKKLREEQKD